MKIKKITKTAEDFAGFHPEQIPDEAPRSLGTSFVDVSRLKNYFSRVDEAVALVNSYNSSYLKDVAYVFDFTKSGAYGVYIDKLSEAIKERRLELELEDMGYQVESENGEITAVDPTGKRDANQISMDMKNASAKVGNMGGVAFGLNMQDIKNAVERDVSKNINVSSNDSVEFDPAKKEWLILINVAATIVHEAAHGLGADEGGAQQAEQSFLDSKMSEINQRYKSAYTGDPENYVPLQVEISKAASNINWYKTAQYYLPDSFKEKPQGSDLTGRFPESNIWSAQGRAPWGMIAQESQGIPLEKKLGRQFMAPLPEDLSQENDTIELQLKKINRDNEKFDPQDGIEQLLSMEHSEDLAYTTLEGLLDENRPKPLMLLTNQGKAAKTASNSKMIKEATTFGWMNNLEISDGSTIPGLSDRVMSWEDADEDFKSDEKKNRTQSRYNPSYNSNGMYYVLNNIRGWPYPADSASRDYKNIYPNSRAASSSLDVDKDGDVDYQDVSLIFKVLNKAKKRILNNEILSTRFISSGDIIPFITKIFKEDKFKIVVSEIKKHEDEDIYSIWVCSSEVEEEEIKKAEKFLYEKYTLNQNSRELLEKLLGFNKSQEIIITEIIDTVRGICKKYGIQDVYLVGGCARDLYMGNPLGSVKDLDFSGAWANQSIKVGGLVAEELGVSNAKLYHRTMTLSFTYKGIKVDFKGNFSPVEIRAKMREERIPVTSLNSDIYNRDFTINMLVYDIFNKKIYDVSKEGFVDIKNGIIKTYFDPAYIIKQNPLIILRALKFKIRYGFEIDPDLVNAIRDNVDLLLGKYPDERLIVGRESVKQEGHEKALALFDMFGLSKLEEL